MNDESLQLIEDIGRRADQDLIRIVYLDQTHYRSEVITYAKAEMAKRGLRVTQADVRQLPDLTLTHPFVSGLQKLRRTSFAIIQAKAFAIGFLMGGAGFVAANIHSYHRMIDRTICCHWSSSFGFPFDWYTFGDLGMTDWHWWNVLANLLVALCLALFGGWLFKRLIKILSRPQAVPTGTSRQAEQS